MSTTTIAVEPREATWASRLVDYVELTKPRIALLVLVTVLVSGYLACGGQPPLALLWHTSLGTLLVAASASALNQWLERQRDAKMPRTAARPLPAGRLSAVEVWGFALVTMAAGSVYLAFSVGWLPTLFAGLTWFLYVWVYTPLKVHTSANTAIGAVSGALPVAIGWTATGGSLADIRLAALLMVLFLWQFPHFMAIAWLYRDQYRQAGMRMLTVVEPSGRRAGMHAVWGAALLPAISVIPAIPLAGAWPFIAGALVLGTVQLACAAAFLQQPDDRTAKRLLRASLLYLPLLFALLLLVPIL